ncbi:MAG: DUF1343 domain-containing protein [Planctomycetota bacterium]
MTILCALSSLILAAAQGPSPQDRGDFGVVPGIEVLERQGFAPLQGKRIGLIANHTAVTRNGRRDADVLAAAEGLELRCLFSPEHGIEGALDRGGIPHGTDERTGLCVYSLYGETRKPTPGMLGGLDALVFDIQDVGCRFYTYASTMRLCLEAASEQHLSFVVLDRPNPLGGAECEGPVARRDRVDFVCSHEIPIRHGLTMGELARMIRAERGLEVDLEVVRCEGWRRTDYYDRTLLRWIAPSPNMRSLNEAVLYPGIGLLEGTNLSVGRGTDTPFEVLGAPWCDGRRLAARLLAEDLPGVAFVPVEFTPKSSKFAGQRCSGVQISVTDRARFRPVRTGIHLACALLDLHRDDWETGRLDWLLRDEESAKAILAGKRPGEIERGWKRGLDDFLRRREPFLLYD